MASRFTAEIHVYLWENGRKLFRFVCSRFGMREIKISADSYENKFVDIYVYFPIYGKKRPIKLMVVGKGSEMEENPKLF